MIKQRWRKTKSRKNKLCSNCFSRVPKDIRYSWIDQKVFCNEECYSSYWSYGMTQIDLFDPFHPLDVIERRRSDD